MIHHAADSPWLARQTPSTFCQDTFLEKDKIVNMIKEFSPFRPRAVFLHQVLITVRLGHKGGMTSMNNPFSSRQAFLGCFLSSMPRSCVAHVWLSRLRFVVCLLSHVPFSVQLCCSVSLDGSLSLALTLQDGSSMWHLRTSIPPLPLYGMAASTVRPSCPQSLLTPGII